MNKAKDALILAVIGLIIAPFETLFITTVIFIPIAGIVLGVLAVILVARFIERQRKEHYPEMNVALFTACMYLPGLIAGIIFCMVMFTRERSPGDINGWGALAGGVLGILVLLSQAAMTVAGIVYALKSAADGDFPPDQEYSSDFPDTESFFDDKGE